MSAPGRGAARSPQDTPFPRLPGLCAHGAEGEPPRQPAAHLLARATPSPRPPKPASSDEDCAGTVTIVVIMKTTSSPLHRPNKSQEKGID